MFIHMSIHYPKPEFRQALRDSMHRFGKALSGQPGFKAYYVLEDQRSDRIVGMVLWESQKHMEDAIHLAREAIKDDPIDLWEAAPTEGLLLDPV